MLLNARKIALVVAASLALNAAARAQEKKISSSAFAVDDFFAKEVWAKVGARTCLNCHKAGGDAEESKFILRDPAKEQGRGQDEALRHNRDAFARMARLKEKDQSRMLVKVAGGLDHGGEDVLKPDSTGYRILAEFVRAAERPSRHRSTWSMDQNAPPFFDGVVMLDDRAAAPPRHAVARRPAADRRRTGRRRRRTG